MYSAEKLAVAASLINVKSKNCKWIMFSLEHFIVLIQIFEGHILQMPQIRGAFSQFYFRGLLA